MTYWLRTDELDVKKVCVSLRAYFTSAPANLDGLRGSHSLGGFDDFYQK
jgi:hypothetical protein